MNLNDILGFVLPKVQDNRQAEARQVLKQTFEPEAPNILQRVLSVFTKKENAPDVASMLSVLLTMVKSEYIEEIQGFFAALFQKK